MSDLRKTRILKGGRTEDRATAVVDPESLKKEVAVLESPAQYFARMRGEKVPKSPPGYSRKVIAAGRDVYEFLQCPTLPPPATEKTGMPITREFMTRAEEAAEEKARRKHEQRVQELEEADEPDAKAEAERWEAVHATAAKHKAERERKAAEADRKAAAIRDTLREAGL